MALRISRCMCLQFPPLAFHARNRILLAARRSHGLSSFSQIPSSFCEFLPLYTSAGQGTESYMGTFDKVLVLRRALRTTDTRCQLHSCIFDERRSQQSPRGNDLVVCKVFSHLGLYAPINYSQLPGIDESTFFSCGKDS